MRLLITNGVQQGRVLQLKPGVNRVGRSIDNHLQLPDPSVSSVHCELIYSDAGVMVRDLHSTNGTFIEGEPIQEAMVEAGQMLQLGNIEMRVETAESSSPGVAVAIPELPVETQVHSTTLADGTLSCVNHPEVTSAFRCTKCAQTLCHACVREVRRISGDMLVFCSLCAGQCEPVEQPVAAMAAPPRKKSLFGRLTDTLKLPFKRPAPTVPAAETDEGSTQ